MLFMFFFFKQKTAYEMRISDWSSDVCSSDLTDVSAMPELERYMLSLLAELDAKMVRAVDDFDYNTYTRLLADFCNEDLSAFYFDIRKDVLYCDLGPAAPLGTDTRREIGRASGRERVCQYV